MPADAFKAYFMVTLQSNGGAINKLLSLASGVWFDTTSAYASCPALKTRPAISYALNTSSEGTMTLSNGKSYALTGGTGAAGTGTAGSPKGARTGPNNVEADACNTYITVALTNSTSTSSSNSRSAVLSYTVNVTGFGITTLTLSIPSFALDSNSNWSGPVTVS